MLGVLSLIFFLVNHLPFGAINTQSKDYNDGISYTSSGPQLLLVLKLYFCFISETRGVSCWLQELISACS